MVVPTPIFVEEFLRSIEPRYNMALAKLEADSVDPECLYVIGGFVAYVLACAQQVCGSNRVHCRASSKRPGASSTRWEKYHPRQPPLREEASQRLLQTGDVLVDIDPKFPQAIGIRSILSLMLMFGNFTWDILINRVDDSPYFTSDFPVAIEESADPRILNRIIPLAPHLAIRIRPDHRLIERARTFSFCDSAETFVVWSALR